MRNRVIPTAIALLLTASLAQSAGLDFLPSREELMKPAPNPAWNQFSMALDAYGAYPIAPAIYLFYYRGINSLFMVTDEGVIVTDPISVDAAAKYYAAIREITDAPIKYVIYSHWHWDHIEGGQIFKDAGAHFIAHEKCLKPLADLPNENIVMPDELIYSNRTIELGGHTLELIYLGPNHSESTLFMRPDGMNTIFEVDMVAPGGSPSRTLMDYIPHHWIRTLKELEAMNLDFVISSHGVPIAHPSCITERREYLEALLAAVKAGRDKGLAEPELHAFVREQMQPFAYMRNFDNRLDHHIIRIATYFYTGW